MRKSEDTLEDPNTMMFGLVPMITVPKVIVGGSGEKKLFLDKVNERHMPACFQ